MSNPFEQSVGTPASFETRAVSLRAWKSQAACALLLAGVVYLLWFSMQLAATHVYGVEECQEVFAAHALAAPSHTASRPGTLFQVLLSWVLPKTGNSAALFAAARLVMMMLFWVNWMLLACATGEKMFSVSWTAALFIAASLAPFWARGFEVCHDNLMLTGILLFWCLARTRPAGMQSHFLTGTLALLLQFVAPQAFVYTLTISAAILIWPSAEERNPRWKLAGAWTAGALAALVVLRTALGLAGLWEPVRAGLALSFANSSAVHDTSLAPGFFIRWSNQAPLLLGLVASGAAVLARELRRKGRAAASWNGVLPEALLLLAAIAAVFVHPGTYPENLLNLAPFTFLFAFRHVSGWLKQVDHPDQWFPVLAGLLVFVHLVPFGAAVQRERLHINSEQERLMTLAETLTDPAKDTVFDLAWLVPTRPAAGVTSLRDPVNSSSAGSEPARIPPPAVIIPNFRTDQLAKTNRNFIRDHYVTVGDDFLVLGNVLPTGGGTFEIVHPGRYRVSALAASDLDGTYRADMTGYLESAKSAHEPPLRATLDGEPLPARPLVLAAGTHRLESAVAGPAVIEWVGPQLDRLPRLGPSNHRFLFANGN
jgi:hypothetical protein